MSSSRMALQQSARLLSRAPRASTLLQAQWRRQASTTAPQAPEHLSPFQYFRKYYWAPEAAPLVAIVSTVIVLAVGFSVNGAKSSDVAWRPRKDEHPWLKVSTDQPHLENTPAYVAPVPQDLSYHGERALQRKSFKVPRWMETQ